ncbi:hypothetical protein MASR1M65_04670 [Saprospiraceae bacterium]
MYPGDLPRDPARVLAPARAGAERWLDADYALMGFAPARMALSPGEGRRISGWTAPPNS